MLLALTSSCKLFTKAANAPSNLATGLFDDQQPPPDPAAAALLQSGVMRFADTFASHITKATNDFAAEAATPEARIQALSWFIGQNTAAFTIASGSNSTLALLDMIALVTLGRMVHEEYWGPKVWGDADRPMLEAFMQLEQQIWEEAGKVLSQAQQDELRSVLRAWREQHQDVETTAFVRLPVLPDLLKAQAAAQTDERGGLGELLSVDPLGGLDPAVREVEQTRLFAERAMFYMQRAPILLSGQVELLGLELMRLPEIHSALEDSQRISQAAASISATAAALPEAVRVEREAAVEQIAGELSLQRQGLLTDLEQAQGPAREIMSEARATLEAGAQMSTALQGALATLDSFIGRFDKKPPTDSAPPAPSAAPRKPFDISDYGDAATRLGAAAHELNGLVTTLDQSLPEVQRVLDEVTARGEQTIDHAFKRGLEFGSLLVAAVALALLAVRWISARLLRGGADGGTSLAKSRP